MWNGAGSGDPNGVFARRYDSSLSPLSGELADQRSDDRCSGRRRGGCDSGEDYVIAWSGPGGPDADGIYAREFAPMEPHGRAPC